MSTYHDSRIRTAGINYVCGNYLPGRGCGDTIMRGERYLSFAPGQRGRIPICLTKVEARDVNDRDQELVTVLGCAFEKTSGGSGLRYNCADIVQEISRQDVESEKGG